MSCVHTFCVFYSLKIICLLLFTVSKIFKKSLLFTVKNYTMISFVALFYIVFFFKEKSKMKILHNYVAIVEFLTI